MKHLFDQSILLIIGTSLLLVGLGYLSLRSIGRLVEASHSVQHTQTVIDRLQYLLTEVEEESRMVRSFVLTTNPLYRQTFENSRQTVTGQFGVLGQLTADNPARQGDLAKLRDLWNQQMAVMERLNQSGGGIQQPELAREIEEGNQLIDQIKDQVTYIQDDERRLLKEHTDIAVHSGEMSRAIIEVGSFSAIVIMLGGIILLRREAGARLRTQRELDRFFTLTTDILCIAGFDGYCKRVNPAWEKVLGFTTEEILATPFMERIHPDDVEKTIAAYEGLKHGDKVLSFENRCRCKNGSYRWLLWSAQPLIGEKLVFASARDLTERKQIEETLSQSEERNRSIIKSAHDAFISIDKQGRIKDWNLQAEAIFGWTRAEALGRLLHETIIPLQYREEHLRGIRHLQVTGDGPVLDKRIELAALRRNGDEFPVEIAIWPLQMEGETTYNAFVRDITVRKEAEKRIRCLNEELKERALQLEASNKELEAFSYSVSHDLRAPLRHIHGFVELLQKSPAIQAEKSSCHQMSVIAKAAKQMGHLIDDLLAFSRTNRIEMHPVRLDMRKMVDDAIESLDAECFGRTVKWDIKPLPEVKGDARLLRQVWVNLLSNALKYTRSREVAQIEVGHTVDDSGTDSGGRKLTFYVRDNGVGFDMQYVSKLFGVFQRLHRSDDFEGTGIGLANVQRIIHRHGGRVWAEGAVDSGAAFLFSIPVDQPAKKHG